MNLARLSCLAALPLLLCCTGQAQASCVILDGDLDFGSVDLSSGAAIDRTFTLTLSCGDANPERNCISYSGGVDLDGEVRQMRLGSSLLRYQLYRNSARTLVWGSYNTGFAGGGVTFDTTSSNLRLVYARIFANQQSVPPGAGFSDDLIRTFTSKDGSSEACPTPSPNISSGSSRYARATVSATCTVSATNLNFGTRGALATATDATSTVTVQCSNGAAYTVGLGVGNGAGATTAERKMTNGANTITYSLYSNSARSALWGATVGTNTVAGTGTGSAVDHTVYGRVPAQTTPAPGAYSDTIVVTVTY